MNRDVSGPGISPPVSIPALAGCPGLWVSGWRGCCRDSGRDGGRHRSADRIGNGKGRGSETASGPLPGSVADGGLSAPQRLPRGRGGLFGASADVSENPFHEGVALLRVGCPSSRGDAEKRGKKSEPRGPPTEPDRRWIDGLETPIRRPSDPDRLRRPYSGKKKRLPLQSLGGTDEKGGRDPGAGHEPSGTECRSPHLRRQWGRQALSQRQEDR